jgi:hypothetical protein
MAGHNHSGIAKGATILQVGLVDDNNLMTAPVQVMSRADTDYATSDDDDFHDETGSSWMYVSK